MRRDRLTFAMIVGIPILQLVLFGYAINTDPKALPTAVVDYDKSTYSRSIVRGAREHRAISPSTRAAATAKPAPTACSRAATCSSRWSIPPDFSRRLERGERPSLLGRRRCDRSRGDRQRARRAEPACRDACCATTSTGPLARLAPDAAPFDVVVQRRYNAEGITQYNIVPGLLGVILQMTMVMMTAFAMTRERERGTFENLLATPAHAARGDDGQDRAVHRRRVRAGGDHPRRGAVPVRRADDRQHDAAVRARWCCSSRRCWRSASRSRRSRATSCRRCR